MKKSRCFDIVCMVIIVLGVFGGLLFQNIEKYVLIDELCGGIAVLGAGVWCAKIVFFIKGSWASKFLFGALAIMFVIVGFVITKDILVDVSGGSKTVVLTDCTVGTRSTSRGIIGLNYYLEGQTSDGTEYRFEISRKDYQQLKDKTTVTVNGYIHTGRIITYK